MKAEHIQAYDVTVYVETYRELRIALRKCYEHFYYMKTVAWDFERNCILGI